MRCWALGFVSFFSMVAAWSLALPVNGTYDEKQHIVWAYAVATGQLTPAGTVADSLGRPSDGYLAPRSILPVGTSVDCTWWVPRKPANCQRWVDDRTRVPTPSSAGRYSPVYYAAVGAPLALWPDRGGVLLARLVSALLSAAVLASALWLAVRSGRRLLTVAVVLTATPTTLNLASAINPNGLEIAAGILVATGAATMLVERTGTAVLPAVRAGTAVLPAERVDRAALLSTAAGSLLLLTIRQLGPVLLAFIVTAFALMAGRDRLGALARRRDVRRILGGAWVIGAGYAGAWLLYSGGVTPGRAYRPAPLGRGDMLTYLVTHRLAFCLRQMVAQFSYGETKVSPLVVVAWYLLLCLLVLPALWYSRVRARLAVAGLGAAGLVVLMAMDLRFYAISGWYSQGRYVLPAVAGVVLFAAVAGRWEERLARRGWTAGFAAAVTAVTVPLQVYTLAVVMTRFQVGYGAPLDPFAGVWRPPVPPVVLLAGMLVGAVLLVYLASAPGGGSGAVVSGVAVSGAVVPGVAVSGAVVSGVAVSGGEALTERTPQPRGADAVPIIDEHL